MEIPHRLVVVLTSNVKAAMDDLVSEGASMRRIINCGTLADGSGVVIYHEDNYQSLMGHNFHEIRLMYPGENALKAEEFLAPHVQKFCPT